MKLEKNTARAFWAAILVISLTAAGCTIFAYEKADTGDTTDTENTDTTDTGDKTDSSLGYPDAADKPDGWASYTGAPTNPGGYGASAAATYTVSTRSQFLSALALGGSSASDSAKIIYVSGMIDLCSDSAGNHLDPEDFISSAGYATSYPAYQDWIDAYAASCDTDTASTLASVRSTLAAAQKAVVIVKIGSNTSILGLGSDAGFKNGSLSVSGKTNVVLRNLTVLDSYDYFPAWDEGENLINSEYDTVTVNSASTYVWIDHCTLGDGDRPDSSLPHVTIGGEDKKWVTHDGLLDVTKGSDFVTISWNQILDHDKTMLFGSSDSNGGTGATNDTDKLRVTVHHNLFDGASQRLPRVRFGKVHVYNNVYQNVGLYSIGVGDHSRIWSENNVFASESTSVKSYDDSANEGYVWDTGSINVKTSELDSAALVGWLPSDFYSYTAETADAAQTSVPAGAGPGQF